MEKVFLEAWGKIRHFADISANRLYFGIKQVLKARCPTCVYGRKGISIPGNQAKWQIFPVLESFSQGQCL